MSEAIYFESENNNDMTDVDLELLLWLKDRSQSFYTELMTDDEIEW